MSNPGGYGGPRPGDFGGCTYRPMGQMPPPSPDAHRPGGCGSGAAAMILTLAILIAILL